MKPEGSAIKYIRSSCHLDDEFYRVINFAVGYICKICKGVKNWL